jgi:hypothetical protein
LKGELAELYRFLMIDPRDRKTFPNAPTAANLQAIEAELKTVESQADTRLSVLLEKYEKEVQRLCKDLAIVDWKQPKYRGEDRSAAVLFYKKAVEDLKQLAAERSRLMEMSQSPEKNEQEYELALEHYRARTGSNLNGGTRYGATRTELSLSSALFVSPTKRLPSAKTKSDLSGNVEQLFREKPHENAPTGQKKLATSGEVKRRKLSPKQKSDWDITLRSRHPFRVGWGSGHIKPTD